MTQLNGDKAAVPAIRVESAVKNYGSLQALKGVSLDIQQGEFFGLLGPNGAGKTTLISALAGLTRLSAGRLSVMGFDVAVDYQSARKALGVVPQELVFDPFFSVREMLRMQSGYFGIARNDDWIDELLVKLDLTDKANANMRSLSGGMKRRVLVAQALVHKPPVIVLDEPTAGVDVNLRHALWGFVRELNAAGHTIVLTTHYLEEAESLCTRIAMLKAGQIIALDSPQNLLKKLRTHALTVTLGAPLTLPAEIAPRSIQADGLRYSFGFDDYAEIEPLLASLRAAGAVLLDIEITKPVLEQVFVELLKQDES